MPIKNFAVIPMNMAIIISFRNIENIANRQMVTYNNKQNNCKINEKFRIPISGWQVNK